MGYISFGVAPAAECAQWAPIKSSSVGCACRPQSNLDCEYMATRCHLSCCNLALLPVTCAADSSGKKKPCSQAARVGKALLPGLGRPREQLPARGQHVACKIGSLHVVSTLSGHSRAGRRCTPPLPAVSLPTCVQILIWFSSAPASEGELNKFFCHEFRFSGKAL